MVVVLNSGKQYYMSNNLSRIIKFAQSTGDKLIVTDVDGSEPFVIMPFEMYEHLVGVGKKGEVVSATTDSSVASEPIMVNNDKDFDDLAIETSYPEPVRVPEPGSESQITEKQDVPVPESPTLAIKQDIEEPPEEEQFYLEPV